MSVLIVIPSRYDSTRFPGKPLVKIRGISLVQRVYERCTKVRLADHVVVATDDERIRRHILGFGGQVQMTCRDHPSGTDRVAEVARKFSCDIVINVQGDEPLLDPKVVQQLILIMKKDPRLMMATLCHPIKNSAEFDNPNAVKVIVNKLGNAIYFSRSAIPHYRDVKSKEKVGDRHIGIYAFRRKFLFQYIRWPQSSLEKAEKLEQLRALERGVHIRVLRTPYEAMGVDVPADVRRVERCLKA